jgi:hypothetical protein
MTGLWVLSLAQPSSFPAKVDTDFVIDNGNRIKAKKA